MPTRDPPLVFFVALPDGRRCHQVARGTYTHAVVVRIGAAWSVDSLQRSRLGAERRARTWQAQASTGPDLRRYEARVVPATCDVLPPGHVVRAALPDGRTVRQRYWPDLGDPKPKYAVAVLVRGTGWRVAEWPRDEREADIALARARQDYPGDPVPALLEAQRDEPHTGRKSSPQATLG